MMGPGLAFGRNYQATIATGGNAGLVFQWSRCPGDERRTLFATL